MRFAVLGYFDETEWDSWSAAEQNAFMDECFAYDEVLKSARDAATVRLRGGHVTVTDGPFAEAKEVLGGILLLEADDLSQAKELIAKHPGVRAGGFEIRPIVDMAPLVQESEERRRRAAGRA